MSFVHILPSDVIAKIAAGEAVDRPASVVKELLENAIDAHASFIEIHLKDAGKELVHIKDNGSGISPEDLKKIFQRHATSKITAIEDLETLHSMGFRGEALYSIAAVSDVTLCSKTAQDEGWQIHLQGGVRQNLQPFGRAGSGTDIKVSELFFNTPARRKFLKNNSTELNQILNVVLAYTLIYPEKRFLLTHANRTLLDLRPAATMIDRVAAALNVEMNHLLETDQEFVEDQIRIRLILGDINIQRPRRNLQYIFINQRPIESKALSFALNDAYKLILPPGVYGCFMVHLKVNPANIDVNIHPTKREVRLKDESKIVSLLRRMAEYQLMNKGQIKKALDIKGGIASDEIIFAPDQVLSQFHPISAAQALRNTAFQSDKYAQNAHLELPLDFQLFGKENDLRSKLTNSRFIGGFLKKYLLFESPESLLILDQHAAQERILFEKFKKQLESAKVETQPLLTPLLIKLSPQEKITWEETHEKLALAGIETNLFDTDTIAIQTEPLLLKNIEHVVRELLSGGDLSRLDLEALAKQACKASVRAGDKMELLEVEYQKNELLTCQDPFICPHGRPTMIEVDKTFLDRQFLRI
ncbi:MAG: DNA mismatch repair endonuclease MutL [Candidatus Omnitrophica bacterium]|nr:DNA mismatch repair endonuclease MutL [Candidatus Omnitrophota bacterium]